MKKVLWISVLLLASACTTTSSRPGGEGSSENAAHINVQLATGYMERGENEIALEKLQRALEIDPDYATAHTVIGVLYGRIGETERSGKHLKRAAELNPEDGGVLNNYGQYLCRIGEFRKAYPYFRKAVEQPFYRTPESALANAGRCAMDEGDLELAEKYLREALKAGPGYPPTLFDLARLMHRQGDYLKARAFLERYHASGQLSAESLYLGYDIEKRLGDDEASEDYRRQLIIRYPESDQARGVL